MTSAPSDNTDSRNAAARLQQHYEQVREYDMRDLFAADKRRFTRFSLQFDGLLFDYSKNRITTETLPLLFEYTRARRLQQQRERMFGGEIINFTEQRAVLHTALRHQAQTPVCVAGQDVMPAVRAELRHMAAFASQVQSGEWRGYGGAPITDVVNIGIGGSDLGPKMVHQALQHYRLERPEVHFVSNVDAVQLENLLARLDAATTLFIVVSKTFTTQETLTNAHTARRWLIGHFNNDEHAVGRHFVAVSTHQQAVQAFGIDAQNIFRFWDWVGGRYSLWSAVGLSVMLAIGEEHFRQLLRGGNAMDTHFHQQPPETNMPVILALLGFWYRQFFGTTSHALLPYDHVLRGLPSYMQQADMESNGKSTNSAGEQVDYSTAGVLWGESGINGQHSFYQLLHQGTQFVPVDFIASVRGKSEHPQHHDIMFANVVAQGEALMRGRSREETRATLQKRGVEGILAEQLLPHMVFTGNRPSNTLLLDEITPYRLGMLIALYEHKIFTQGILWGINSYDQWGVELGKQLAGQILPQLRAEDDVSDHDVSTNGLINYYRRLTEGLL